MRAVRNDESGTWHLVGNRGCGATPDGTTIEGSWALLRDEIERDTATQCRNCRWPRK